MWCKHVLVLIGAIIASGIPSSLKLTNQHIGQVRSGQLHSFLRKRWTRTSGMRGCQRDESTIHTRTLQRLRGTRSTHLKRRLTCLEFATPSRELNDERGEPIARWRWCTELGSSRRRSARHCWCSARYCWWLRRCLQCRTGIAWVSLFGTRISRACRFWYRD